MRSHVTLSAFAAVLRTMRTRAPRWLNQPAPTSPSPDAAKANLQLERLAACWAAGHRNNRTSNGSPIL